MNKLLLIGRLVRDNELKSLKDDRLVLNNTLAVNRIYKKNEGSPDADFIPFTVWGKRAELIMQYCKKGDLIALDGRIQSRSYRDSEDKMQYVVEMIVENIQFLEPKKDKVEFVEKKAQPATETFI